MLLEGWRETTLGKCLSIMSGYAFKSDDFCDHGVPVIRISNITDMFDIDLLNCVYHNDMGKDFSYIAKMHDVLIAMSGATTGKIGIYKNSEIAYINQRVGKICINDSIANLKYFFYVLNQNYIQKYILKEAIGGAQPNISNRQISIIKINIPPLPEQEKIAAILSTWDKAISTTDALLATSRQQKKALMQQLLTGKRRLPGFTGEWKTILLSDIAVRLNERNNGKSDNVVTISAQKGLIRQEEFFNKSIASENLDTYLILHKGQFAYNKSYSIGHPMGAIKRLKLYETGVVTSLYICFDITSRQADANFYEHCFESGLLNAALTKIAAEGGRAHGLLNVRPADFMHISVPLPPLDEQRAIAAVLDAADREIVLLEQKAARLREEKKALMQQLLTGKRRVRL